jgi:arabinan endo-1,5-alpha-L-arabinosidase
VTLAFVLMIVLAGCGIGPANSFVASTVLAATGEYANPLRITLPDGSLAESCPDPSVIHGQTSGDDYWYMYCTNERFHDNGRIHLMPISKSKDLVNWTYVGDIFQNVPSWVAGPNLLWAPDIQYFNGKYYLYYAAGNTVAGGAAIFVAISETPVGPWTAIPTPVVEPEPVPGRGMRSTIDSFLLQDGGQKYIFYGSFNGGISVRFVSSDGLTSDRASEVQVAQSDRYEAAYVVKHDGYFYLMVSAGGCCAGPLSGYGVYVARSRSPFGPYIDKDGNSMMDARVGGTPILTMNGNRWIGPGHNAVVIDAGGQDWMMYHAIDAEKPYFAGSWTRRPVMLDPIEWIDGWPTVRGGAGPSDASQPAPVMDSTSPSTYQAVMAPMDSPGTPIAASSDEFNGNRLSSQWSWIRPPASGSFAVANGVLQFNTQNGDIYEGRHDASVLTEPVPAGDYMIEVKLSTSQPITGIDNFVQGGVVIYKDDSSYVKLVASSINTTRQIEFGKQVSTSQSPLYGATFLASPSDWTWLRLVKRSAAGHELYTAYSSHDGVNWTRGGTWTHSLGPAARIGLVSMCGAGFQSYFDYIRVYTLQ